jgi:hypothetical protein
MKAVKIQPVVIQSNVKVTPMSWLSWSEFGVSPNLQVYHRFPNQITTALPKVGGFLALFKIATFLSILHKSRFEKKTM